MPWIREFAAIPTEVSARELGERLIAVGLEVETIETVAQVSGPVVLGRVVAIEELTEFKKPIRACQVDVGAVNGGVRDIVCGARNFAVGDGVVVALPGATLPGGFVISSRKTYGRLSDGMICSAAELEVGASSDGIIVLPVADEEIGLSAESRFEFNCEVLDIAVTPDRGYCFSIRGVAREAAIALDVAYRDPIDAATVLGAPVGTDPVACSFDDSGGCDLFTARTLRGVDCSAPTPEHIASRLVAAGMRPVSLVVDITNYVMLETGQPLHAFDEATLRGGLVARTARAGEQLVTLDHVERELSPEDLVIADDTGPVAMAGTMGGAGCEIGSDTTGVVLEAAHFNPVAVAKMSRRHKLSSEASRRFERAVDPALAPYASELAAALVLRYGGGEYVGLAAVESPTHETSIVMAADLPSKVSGADIPAATVKSALNAVGCQVEGQGQDLVVTVPSWRPDLCDPADLVEEVVRLFGYHRIPSRLPRVSSGRGLTANQQAVRRVRRLAAALGLVEVLNYPFIGLPDLEAAMIAEDDPRQRVVELLNPLSDRRPLLRTTLLLPLFDTAARNVSRGIDSVAIFECGTTYELGQAAAAPALSVADRPSDDDLALLGEVLPIQRRQVAGVLSGQWERSGWWGSGRLADWTDAVRIASQIIGATHVDAEIVKDSVAPFHPGRCARLRAGGVDVGFAGEVHPNVVAAWGLPARSCAFEFDLDALLDIAATAELKARPVRTFPVAKFDLALLVEDDVPADAVRRAIAQGAGDLVESVEVFDLYQGDQIPPGKKSVACAVRLRALDRTLAEDEVSHARAASLAKAEQLVGAQLRR